MILRAFVVLLLAGGLAPFTYLRLERIGRRGWVPLVCRGIAWAALGLLLRSQADATVRVAIFLADVVLSPLLFLGAAIVYVDLVARIGLTRDERRKLRQAALGRPE